MKYAVVKPAESEAIAFIFREKIGSFIFLREYKAAMCNIKKYVLRSYTEKTLKDLNFAERSKI